MHKLTITIGAFALFTLLSSSTIYSQSGEKVANVAPNEVLQKKKKTKKPNISLPLVDFFPAEIRGLELTDGFIVKELAYEYKTPKRKFRIFPITTGMALKGRFSISNQGEEFFQMTAVVPRFMKIFAANGKLARAFVQTYMPTEECYKGKEEVFERIIGVSPRMKFEGLTIASNSKGEIEAAAFWQGGTLIERFLPVKAKKGEKQSSTFFLLKGTNSGAILKINIFAASEEANYK